MGALDLCLDIVEYKRKNYISVSASLKLFLELIKVINFSTEEHKIIWRCSKRTHESDIIIYIKKREKKRETKNKFSNRRFILCLQSLILSYYPLSSPPFLSSPLLSPTPLISPSSPPPRTPLYSPRRLSSVSHSSSQICLG